MSEEKKLIDLSEISFKAILDADIHQDNKAGRILSAMAFLTAAAAAIFVRAYSNSMLSTEVQETLSVVLTQYINPSDVPSVINSVSQSLREPPVKIFGIEWPLLAFSGYILFVILGAVLYLAALGPSLNIPSWFRSRDEEESKIGSLLFFDKVAEYGLEKWKAYWKDTPVDELHNKMANNYIEESLLIAEKAKAKVIWMSLGSMFFKISIIFLSFLATSLFSFELELLYFFSFLSFAGILWMFVFETKTRPPRESKWWIVWIIFAVIASIGALCYLFRWLYSYSF